MNEKKKVGVGFGVMVIKDNKILLGLRNDDGKKADSELYGEGTWTMPGGKLEYGETFEQGGIREVKEETNIDVKDIEVFCVQNDLNEFAHFVTIGMIAKSFTGEEKVMEPDEIVEWKWFDINNVPTNFFFPSARCLEKYKEELFYKED